MFVLFLSFSEWRLSFNLGEDHLLLEQITTAWGRAALLSACGMGPFITSNCPKFNLNFISEAL